jgi:DNA modification methylase
MNYIINGDSLQELKKLPDNSIDSVVTDPPYHLTSITKRFGKKDAAPASTNNNDGSFARLSKGFMGKEWDGVDENGLGIANNVEL